MTTRSRKRLKSNHTAAAELRLPALRVRQGKDRTLFTFAVDGKRIHEFATISRIKRANSGEIVGYQRPEVLSHINEIQGYLESGSPMIPNAVVIAFDDRVRFEGANATGESGYSLPGEIVIPIDSKTPDQEKPGWVV